MVFDVIASIAVLCAAALAFHAGLRLGTDDLLLVRILLCAFRLSKNSLEGDVPLLPGDHCRDMVVDIYLKKGRRNSVQKFPLPPGHTKFFGNSKSPFGPQQQAAPTMK
jgi:hypothetical protein